MFREIVSTLGVWALPALMFAGAAFVFVDMLGDTVRQVRDWIRRMRS